jgi:hypothetical protein
MVAQHLEHVVSVYRVARTFRAAVLDVETGETAERRFGRRAGGA